MAQVLIHQDPFESVVDAEFLNPNPDYTASLRGMLQDLSIDNAQNRRHTLNSSAEVHSTSEQFRSQRRQEPSTEGLAEAFCHPRVKSRGLRRRAAIEFDTFEPLDVVQEESSSCLEAERSAASGTSQSAERQQSNCVSKENLRTPTHPLLTAEPKSSSEEFLKHLAGQFEWLITYPPPAGSTIGHGSPNEGNTARTKGTVVYGCNLLSRNPRRVPQEADKGPLEADTYTLIATPIEGDENLLPNWDIASARNLVDMMLLEPPSYEGHHGFPPKSPEVVHIDVQATSPALTFVSERSNSYAGSSTTAGSFCAPRIEDSLEELDKLEDQLEALNAVTHSRRITSPDHGRAGKRSEPTTLNQKSTILKRSSFAGQAATVRLKKSEKAQSSIRRSTSLIFNDRKQDETANSPNTSSRLSRNKSVNSLSATPKGTIKSTKPLTVPNFELPGEAIARRLREQREARKAQQAEAEKANAVPQKSRFSKLLTKPTFELPGEAISRRKREERELRLKAQEEEERKRREFKARPVRFSITPSTLPRDTVASRARQGKIAQDSEDSQQVELSKSKRLSVGVARGGSISNKAPQARGRLSTAVSHEDLSRATSTSTGSIGGKRNTLSAEETQQLKIRGKEIFTRDNTRFKEDREREKREREQTARTAREQAAERSRAASREWAEKKRRKEQALKDAMRQEMAA